MMRLMRACFVAGCMQGLLVGMLAALATQLVCLALITLLFTDWRKQVS